MTYRNQSRSKWQLVVLAMILSLLVGCEVEAEGEEGNFSFIYLNSEGTGGASDLAVGSSVHFEVRDTETETPLELVEVYSEAGDVIDVDHIRDSRFTATAHEGGTARITAEATADGDVVAADTIELRAAEASAVELESLCSSDRYFTDGTALMRHAMEDGSGTALTGFGHYPVSIEPGDGGQIGDDYERLGFLRLHTGSEPGDYEVVSDFGDDSQPFELIDAADIDAVEPTNYEPGDTVTSVEVGESVHAAPFTLNIGEDQICGTPGSNVMIKSEQPHICEARYGREFENAPTLLDLHMVVVEGIEPGVCEIEVAVPAAGLELAFEVEVTGSASE